MLKQVRPLIVVLAIVVSFVMGLVAGQAPAPASAGSAVQVETNPYVQRFERVWTLVHEEYFAQPVDDEALIQGAIAGMLEQLGDQHTSYMPPDEYARYTEDFSGSYTGIGALVEAEGDRLIVVSPFDGSPAKAAGIRPGDEIVQVDDTPISDFDDPLAAITLVRGPEGAPVTLRIKRDGRLFDVTIIRATIQLVSASGELRADGVGYVRLSDFGQMTVAQLRETLSGILAQKPQGLVLDLRGNPGGSLDAALYVTSEFIGDGTIMLEEWGNGAETSYTTTPGGLATDPSLPLVVLVDEGSASASEIVAGALQDRGRGRLVGDVTFGKGTVQNWHDLGAGQGGVRITIARWLTPNGTWVHEKGLTPDVLVEASDSYTDTEWDLQLETAVSLLLGKPLPSPPASKILRCCGPRPE
ncbi:MAG: S41 family peptidase [Ardenticatenaceae bacterium]